MKLADVRKVAIRKGTKIRFAVSDSLECVINEHGIAQVPGLAGLPEFNLEDALRGASQFTLEPVSSDKKKPLASQLVTAQQLAAMAAAGGPEQPHHDEHDE